MKKAFNFFKLAFVLFSCLLCQGCQSAKVDITQNTPMAIMSIKGNPHLPWYEEKDGKVTSSSQGLLARAIDNNFDYEDPELATAQERLDYAEDFLRKTLTQNNGIEVFEKDVVLSSKKYKIISEGLFSSLNTSIAAEGYKVLDSVSAMDLKRVYKDTGAKGAIVLKFEFFKLLKRGSKSNGVAVPYITMRAKVYNGQGKEVFAKTYKQSGQEFKISSKNYDKEEFVKLYPTTIETLINMLSLDLL